MTTTPVIRNLGSWQRGADGVECIAVHGLSPRNFIVPVWMANGEAVVVCKRYGSIIGVVNSLRWAVRPQMVSIRI